MLLETLADFPVFMDMPIRKRSEAAMKRQYSKPIVQKISFDYKTQIVTQSTPSQCFGSVINVATSYDQCGEGTRNYFGWNLEHPGNF